MPNKCLYPKCSSKKINGKLKSLFRFPKNDELLRKWKQMIPLVDFKDVDLDQRHLCEEHFEESLVVIKNKSKKLVPNAIPTRFEEFRPDEVDTLAIIKPIIKLPEHDNNCRLCLKKFEPCDDKINICKKVKKQYSLLTNTELRSSKVYSQKVCKKCLEELKKCYQFKKNLLSNQEKLHKIFESMEDQENSTQLQKNEYEENPTNLENIVDELEDAMMLEPEPEQDEDDDGIEEFQIEKETYNEKRLRIAKERILCSECGKYFSRASIKKHIGRTHLKIVRAICDLCARHFYTKHGLTEHMKIHIGIKSYKCDQPGCSESFMSRGGLHAHKNLKHLGTYDIYCHLCGKKFLSKVNFEVHLRSTHTGERPFVCEHSDCGKAYFSKTMLQSHRKNVHSSSVSCQVCGKVYSSGDSLRKHLKAHQDVRFTCNFQNCGKQFLSNHLLRLHMKIHLGEKDYVCQYAGCSSRYHKNVSLKKHIWAVHMRLRIPCEIAGCSADFARKELLRKHVQKQHQNIGEENLKNLLDKIRNMKLPAPEYNSVA